MQAKIGVTAQEATVDEMLTGRQNLVMSGRLSGLRRADARRLGPGPLLERFELTDAGDRVVKGYSGGMRRRLDLAAGLVIRPPVLFLDEPTTGLDPVSRVRMWGVIREPGRRWRHAAADDPVPGGGRRAGRPDHRGRPRQGDRRGHRGRAEGPDRGARLHVTLTAAHAGAVARWPLGGRAGAVARTGGGCRPRCAAAPGWPARWCGPWTRRGPPSTTSRSTTLRSTTCSSP